MDFRTYLQGEVNNRTANAGTAGAALQYVGGDYTGQGTTGIDLPKFYNWNSLNGLNDPNTANYLSSLSGLYSQYQGSQGGGGNVLGAVEGATSAQNLDWNSRLNTTRSSANSEATNTRRGLENTTYDLMNQLRSGQEDVDNFGINNMMSKRKGKQDIMDMVGRGVQSGGVMLSGRNAAASSGAEALARAYGSIGGRQLNSVANQFEQGKLEAGQMQGDLQTQYLEKKKDIEDEVANTVNDLVTGAEDKLQTLDSLMINANVLDRIDIQAEKERIKSSVQQILGNINSELQSQRQGIQQMSPEQIQAEAVRRMSLGQATNNPFNYTTTAPGGFQSGSAPAGGVLPIYTSGQRRREG